MNKFSILMLFIINLAQSYAYADQNLGFDSEKIGISLSKLLSHKELLLKGSTFGQNEILFFNPVTERGFVAETRGGGPFSIRTMSTEEFTHSKKVLDENSLYSQESFGRTRLVVTLCRDCVLRKFREFSASPLAVAMIGEHWLASLTFHEHMHAFDQKNWGHIYSKYPANCSVKIQEGSAFLAEARAYSLLTWGNTLGVMDYFSAFSVSGDQTFEKMYLLPAMRLMKFERETGSSYIDGLMTNKVNPCE